MREINLPPFYVGQKVVSLIDGHLVKKGDIKTVLSIYKYCCVWHIDVGLISPIDWTGTCPHGTKLVIKKGKPLHPESICFAPVQENFQSISLTEILKQETKLVGAN